MYAHSVCVFCALTEDGLNAEDKFQFWISKLVSSLFFSYKCDRHQSFSFPVNHLIRIKALLPINRPHALESFIASVFIMQSDTCIVNALYLSLYLQSLSFGFSPIILALLQLCVQLWIIYSLYVTVFVKGNPSSVRALPLRAVSAGLCLVRKSCIYVTQDFITAHNKHSNDL